MQDDDPAWNNLLDWLQSMDHRIKQHLLVCSKRIPGAGRGLFTTTRIPPNTPLFTVPVSAHINVNTLSPLYGSSVVSRLTATQLISMHLFLHRPDPADNTSTDPRFGPYISILPKNFDEHPLSWLINYSDEDSGDTSFLIDCLPPAAQRALNAMADRFWEDWKVVSQFLRTYQTAASTRFTTHSLQSASKEHTKTYLWAWLNVNTRCIYHRLYPSASNPDNLTLCPLLDMANHTSFSVHASSTNPIPTFISPSSHVLSKGEEVYLRYGPHSNIKLFTEYGFVEKDLADGGQVDVQDILESLFLKKGALGEWMKNILKSTKYWGDWTLHEAPAPQPSYRILPALRLMQLPFSTSPGAMNKVQASESPDLQAWHDTIIGEKDLVSAENEQAVREQLLEVCDIAATRAEEALGRLQGRCQKKDLQGWRMYAIDAIKTLWLEETRVATAVMESIKNGGAII